MAAIGDHAPKYRHFKPKDLGGVRIDGRDHYLGTFGSTESWEKYHRLLAERYARGPSGTLSGPEDRPEIDVIRAPDPDTPASRCVTRWQWVGADLVNVVSTSWARSDRGLELLDRYDVVHVAIWPADFVDARILVVSNAEAGRRSIRPG
jgi:hypothetical protein